MRVGVPAASHPRRLDGAPATMGPVLAEAFETLVDAVVGACREVYGDRLRGVVVFGSVARGTMRPDSDVDLLVVAEPLPDGRLPRMEEFDTVERAAAPALDAAWRRGVTTRLAPFVCTPAELDTLGFLGFDVACDGVVRFDERGSLAAWAADVRARLERRGAERREIHGSRYWVLDPDVRPGQVVSL